MKLQREDIHPLQDTCPYFICRKPMGKIILRNKPYLVLAAQKPGVCESGSCFKNHYLTMRSRPRLNAQSSKQEKSIATV